MGRFFAGCVVGAAAMAGLGLELQRQAGPGPHATLPRPAAGSHAAPGPELRPGDFLPPQALPIPTRPAGE